MRNIALVLIFLSPVLFSCNKDNNDGPDVPAGYQFHIGTTNNAVFYSNLQIPDTTYKEGQHIIIREVDLDGDGVVEFNLISELDSIYNEIEFKSLRIQKHPDFTGSLETYLNSAIELLSPEYFVDGEVVIISEWLYPIDQVVYLAQVSENYITNEIEYLGIWNGAIRLNFIVKTVKDGKSFISWVKISVTDYDKYIFYNYATFEM